MTAQRLVLIRHAKSADGPIDIERPLAPRGRADAKALGRWLADSGIALDRVVVSPAVRARQTWDAAHSALPNVPAEVFDERIYDNTVPALLAVVHDTPAGVGSLALVGHNPSFEDLADSLDDGHGDEEAVRRMHDKYPTSGIAVFEVPGGWDEVRAHSATLSAFVVPRGSS